MVASLRCVFPFCVAPVLVGLRKQFINNFFPTWACAVGFNINNDISCTPVYRRITYVHLYIDALHMYTCI